MSALSSTDLRPTTAAQPEFHQRPPSSSRLVRRSRKPRFDHAASRMSAKRRAAAARRMNGEGRLRPSFSPDRTECEPHADARGVRATDAAMDFAPHGPWDRSTVHRHTSPDGRRALRSRIASSRKTDFQVWASRRVTVRKNGPWARWFSDGLRSRSPLTITSNMWPLRRMYAAPRTRSDMSRRTCIPRRP